MRTKANKNNCYINISQPTNVKSEKIPRKQIEKLKNESKKRLQLIQHKNDFECIRNQISKNNKLINICPQNYEEIGINQTKKKFPKENNINNNDFITNYENQKTINKLLVKMKKNLSLFNVEKIKNENHNKNFLPKVKSSSYYPVNRYNISLGNSFIQKNNLMSKMKNSNSFNNNDDNKQQRLSNSNLKFNPNSKFQLKVISSLTANNYDHTNKKIHNKPKLITVNKNQNMNITINKNNINDNLIYKNQVNTNNSNNENLNYFSDSELSYESKRNNKKTQKKQIEEIDLRFPLNEKHRPTYSNNFYYQTLDSSCYNKKLITNYSSLFNTDKRINNNLSLFDEYKKINLPRKKIIVDKNQNYIIDKYIIKNKNQKNSGRLSYLATYSPFYKNNKNFEKLIYKHKSINSSISHENSPFFSPNDHNYLISFNNNSTSDNDGDIGLFDLTKSSNYSLSMNINDFISPSRIYKKQKPSKSLHSSETLNYFGLRRKSLNKYLNETKIKIKKSNNKNVFIKKYYNYGIKKRQINKKTSYNKNYYYMSKYTEYLFNVALKPQIKFCYISKTFYSIIQIPISNKCYYNKKNILKTKNIPMTQNIYYNVLINKVNINHNITAENSKDHKINHSVQVKYNKPIIVTKNKLLINKSHTNIQNNQIIFLFNIISYSNYNKISKNILSTISLNEKNINLLINKVLKFAVISGTKYNILYAKICREIYQELLKTDENESFKNILLKECKLKFEELINNEESNYLISFINFVVELIKTNLFTEDFGFYYIEKLFIEYYKNNFNTPIKDISQISFSAIILLEEIGKIANKNKIKKNIEYINNFIRIDLKDILRNNDKNSFIKNKINNLIDLYKNNWVINKKNILCYYLDYNIRNEFLNNNEENNLVNNICNIEINYFNIILVVKKDLELFSMFLAKGNNSSLYDWSKINDIIKNKKCDIIEIIFSYIEISIDKVNNSEDIDINNKYIENVINLFSEKLLDNKKEILHNKLVKLFLNIKNICIENNNMHEIMGSLLSTLIENNFFFIEDLNLFYEKEDEEIIIIAKCCKFAFSKLKNKKYVNELKKLNIFCNKFFRNIIET